MWLSAIPQPFSRAGCPHGAPYLCCAAAAAFPSGRKISSCERIARRGSSFDISLSGLGIHSLSFSAPLFPLPFSRTHHLLNVLIGVVHSFIVLQHPYSNPASEHPRSLGRAASYIRQSNKLIVIYRDPSGCRVRQSGPRQAQVYYSTDDMSSSSPPQVGFYPPRYSVDARANFSLPSGSTSSLPLRPEKDAVEEPLEAPPVHPAYRGRSRSVRFDTTGTASSATAAQRPEPPRRISKSPGAMPNIREPYAPREDSVSPPLDEPHHNILWTPVSRSNSPVPVPPIPQELRAPPPALRQSQQPQKPTVSRPTTPRRASEQGSLGNKSSITSLQAHAHDQLVSNEKHPYKSSKLRPRSESAVGSITSTYQTSRTHRKSMTPSPTPSNFAQRVFDAGKGDLLYDLKQSTRMPWNFRDEKHGVLDLTTLQRMQQHVLQQKLVEQVRSMGEKGTWMEIGIGETMKDYCEFRSGCTSN